MLYRAGSKQVSQGYVMAMQGVDRDRCRWGALLKCNLPQPGPPTYFWRASSGDVQNRSKTWSLNPCSCFLPSCAPELSS